MIKIISILMLIILSVFAKEYPTPIVNLKEPIIEDKYVLGLMYYFGEGTEQNLEKAKEIYKPLDKNSSTILQLYSYELKELIDNNTIPDENTSLNAFKNAFKKYKISNNLNEWEIKFINEFINSWNNENQIIKLSSDKKSKIFSYPSNIITDAGDGFLRKNFIKIEKQNQSVSFLEDLFDKDQLEKFDFLDNDKILIQFTNLNYSNTYMIDLNTYFAKLIHSGLDYQINKINNKPIITIGTWTYKKEGGRVYYKKSYDENGKKIEAPLFSNFLKEWDYSLNSKNINHLKNVYLDSIYYYSKKISSKTNVLKDKERLLNKYPNFFQRSNLLSVEQLSQNEYKIYYSKDVVYGKKNETFYSYLNIELINDEIFVKEENDISEY